MGIVRSEKILIITDYKENDIVTIGFKGYKGNFDIYITPVVITYVYYNGKFSGRYLEDENKEDLLFNFDKFNITGQYVGKEKLKLLTLISYEV